MLHGHKDTQQLCLPTVENAAWPALAGLFDCGCCEKQQQQQQQQLFEKKKKKSLCKGFTLEIFRVYSDISVFIKSQPSQKECFTS